MRILFLISQLPEKTGSGTYTMNLMKEAINRGHKVGLLYGMNLGEAPYIGDEVSKFPVIFNGIDFDYPLLGMSDNMPYISRSFDSINEDEFEEYKLVFSEKIKDAIKDFRPNLIISNHYFIMSSLVKKVAKDIKLCLISHGSELRQLNKDLFFNEEVREGIRKADIFFSLGKDDAEKISDFFNIPLEKIILIGGGYDDEIFYASNKVEEGSHIELVYCGKLSFEKGVHCLLRVFDHLSKKYKLKLTLAGSGEGKEAEEILRLAEMIGSVRVLGYITQTQVGDVFRESDIFCLPSFYEGLSLTNIEALACGLYVVTTEIKSLIERLGPEINESGDILYVKHPNKFEYKDITPEEIVDFEYAFAEKLSIQIEKVLRGEFTSKDTISSIKRFSWKNIFDLIEKEII
ncbi:MAG: glycosyltransferase family 4 protein [Tissierellia bacterium]|nr:glycosyltransferase family 4 protein [Tissierellia bacterium]